MSAPEPPRRIPLAWLVVILLVPVALLNYLDRQMLAAMRSSMMTDIPDIGSGANWGIVLASFKWVYAVLSPVGGFLADRLSRRHVICISLAIWSAVTLATGHVSTFHELVAARAIMGVSEAFYIPAALALIADFHLGPTRSRAVGFHQMGIYAGIILGGFAGYAADSPSIGWRGAFDACGVVGILYAVPLFLLLRNPPRESADSALAPSVRLFVELAALPIVAFTALFIGAVHGLLPMVWTLAAGAAVFALLFKVLGLTPASPLRAWGELLANPNFILLVLYFTLPAIAGWVVKDWMPAILRDQFGLGQGKAGVSAVVYVQVASLIGAGLGGWLADRWMQRTIRGRIFVSALGVSLFLPSLFGIGHAATLAVAVGFLILFGLGWGFFDCNNMPILCQIAAPHLRASGYGLMNLVSISCGGFGDWGFGALRDRHVPLDVIFGVFAGIALLSAGIVLAIRPKPAVG